MLISRIAQLTVPCSDDGVRFVTTNRLDLIRRALLESQHECVADLPLAKIFRHRHFQKADATILVSCHIDSCYRKYFAASKDGEMHGTFDNSACNAIAVEAMLNNLLPAQVLVSFTGDEENQSRGVDQTIAFLQEVKLFDSLEMVVILDITEEYFQSRHFTVENYFFRERHAQSLLHFDGKRDLKRYLRTMLESPAFVEDAAPDEAWQYGKYDLNCFSLCLPCRVLGSDMHADTGVTITEASIDGFSKAFGQCAQRLIQDLAVKTLHRSG